MQTTKSIQDDYESFIANGGRGTRASFEANAIGGMNAYDTMLKTLMDVLATMDANGIALPVTRQAIRRAIAKAELERLSSENGAVAASR